MTVKSPSPSSTVCKGFEKHTSAKDVHEVRWNNIIDVTDSPFYIDTYENVFVSFGCDGYASLYNDTGGIIVGCSSTCSLAGQVIDGCNGYHCCQEDFDFQGSYSMKRYSIGVTNNTMNGNEISCRSTFLIERSFLRNNYTAATIIGQAVPFAIGWKWDEPTIYPTGRMYYIVIIPGLVALILCCGCFGSCWLCITRKRRKEAKLRKKYFKNKLTQSSSHTEVINQTKLFTEKELKKATGNFKGDRILGEGGQGTVYRGMLSNGNIIAVKKSKTFEESKWMDFINEVVLLSQVNHRNIVKILGCCLETKVPILVYEFISNGTLSQHLHNSTSKFLLTWEMRLRIATEAANAIAYLHSSSGSPIYHRDIKTSNILLDDFYQVKVSDFGIAKAICIDQTHLTTRVQGTFGYLDPEYFRFSQFSEKSDVYSFGVVLIELLTGQHPIRVVSSSEEERSLVEYFISAMNLETLEEILDPIVYEEIEREELMLVANLTKRCLNSMGVRRPSMKEVVMELGRLKNKSSTMPISIGNVSTASIENIYVTLSSPNLKINNNVYSGPVICSSFTSDLVENCDRSKRLFLTS